MDGIAAWPLSSSIFCVMTKIHVWWMENEYFYLLCPPLLFYLLCPKTSQSRNGGCVLISNGWKLSYLSTTVSKSGPPTKTSVCTISQGRQRRLATKKREIFRLPSSWAANKMEDKRKGIHTKAHWNRHLCHLGSPLIREVAVSNFRWSFSI